MSVLPAKAAVGATDSGAPTVTADARPWLSNSKAGTRGVLSDGSKGSETDTCRTIDATTPEGRGRWSGLLMSETPVAAALVWWSTERSTVCRIANCAGKSGTTGLTDGTCPDRGKPSAKAGVATICITTISAASGTCDGASKRPAGRLIGTSPSAGGNGIADCGVRDSRRRVCTGGTCVAMTIAAPYQDGISDRGAPADACRMSGSSLRPVAVPASGGAAAA